MTKFILAGTLSFMMTAAYATPTTKVTAKAEDCPEEATGLEKDMKKISSKVQKCPDGSKLVGICSIVSNKEKDKTPNSNFEYLYERRIYEASCADYENDSDEEIAKKISKLFAENQLKLICQGANFDVIEGNIMKYAINGRTFGFIDKAIDEWKINLNVVDKADKTTVLDYVQMQIDKNRNSSFETTLQNYYNKLRKAGAKHSRELKG